MAENARFSWIKQATNGNLAIRVLVFSQPARCGASLRMGALPQAEHASARLRYID